MFSYDNLCHKSDSKQIERNEKMIVSNTLK